MVRRSIDCRCPAPSCSTSTERSSTPSSCASPPGSEALERGRPADRTRPALAPLIGLDGKRLAREIAALAGRPDRRGPRRGDRPAVRRDLRTPEPGAPAAAGHRAAHRRAGSARGSPGRSRPRAARSRSTDVRGGARPARVSRRSSTPATSSTRSPSRTCCCSPRTSSGSSRRRAGTSATRPGTWSRRSPRA